MIGFCTSTVKNSGKLFRSHEKPTHRDPPQMAENSNQWQNPINSWEDVRRKFHLSDDRYVEFEFLLYLDIENEFIQNEGGIFPVESLR